MFIFSQYETAEKTHMHQPTVQVLLIIPSFVLMKAEMTFDAYLRMEVFLYICTLDPGKMKRKGASDTQNY